MKGVDDVRDDPLNNPVWHGDWFWELIKLPPHLIIQISPQLINTSHY